MRLMCINAGFDMASIADGAFGVARQIDIASVDVPCWRDLQWSLKVTMVSSSVHFG